MIGAWLGSAAGCVAIHVVLNASGWLKAGLISTLVAVGAWALTPWWIKAWNLTYRCSGPVHLLRLLLVAIMALGGWLVSSYSFALSTLDDAAQTVPDWVRGLVPEHEWIWELVEKVFKEDILHVATLRTYIENSRLAVVAFCLASFVVVMGIVANRAFKKLRPDASPAQTHGRG